MLLSPKPVTIRIPSDQAISPVDFLPLAPTYTEVATVATVQPADPTTVVNDLGYSGQERLLFFVHTEVKGVDELGDGRAPYRITYNGGDWVCWKVRPWPALGPIPAHWEVDAYLAQPLAPAAGEAP